MRIQKEKEQEERLKQYQERRRIQKIYERQKKEFEKVQANGKTYFTIENTYASVITKKKNNEKDKPRQLTWDQLENLNTNYFSSNKDDDFNPKDFIDLEDGYDSDDGLLLIENKNDNITNNSTRIHDSINYNSEFSDKKSPSNVLRSSKSVSEKIATKSTNNKAKPPVNRESISKGENRINNETINIHKTDISNANKSVNVETKNTLDRARDYEKQLEDRKDKVK